jgi:septum formation protein
MKVTLASTSQIRRELLTQAGVKFDIARPDVDEDKIKSELSDEIPEYIATALAKAKSLGFLTRDKSELVIGADQLLSFEGQIWNKPANIAAARQQLMALRGKVHFLETAVACSHNGTVVWSHRDCAELTVRDFSDDFLETYLNLEGERVCSSVGGYKLEGRGIQLFSKIRGDYFAILGLPLLPLLSFLQSKGALPS